MLLATLRLFSFSAIASAVLQSLGILWLVVEPIVFFLPDLAPALRGLWWLFLFGGLSWGAYRGWPRLSVSCQISETDAVVEVKVCDVFDCKGAVVVGSNTTFDTSLEDGTISPSSTQGQFTTRFCAGRTVELDAQLVEALREEPFQTRRSKRYGNANEYPMGTVAQVIFKDKVGYFVAIARLNSAKVAESTREEVLDTLPKLWEFIRKRGTLGRIAMPVVGSGHARVNAKREDLIREIVKSFVAAAKVGYFCERLVISIAPSDFSEQIVDLRALEDFLKYECVYAHVPGSASHLRGAPASLRAE